MFKKAILTLLLVLSALIPGRGQEKVFYTQYPTEAEYDSIMQAFADSFPAICTLDSIGESVQGRPLWMLKISDNVAIDEPEPEFYYTSTMHGDETLGFILMLRFADSILGSYGSDPGITSMINSMELFINPLANPDGMFRFGWPAEGSLSRFNADGTDLNRNFPDPWNGLHPDNREYAPENLAQMEFMNNRHIVMSANFHSGYEVVNYPWDNFTSSQKMHPDNDWFIFISREYADTVHKYAPAAYFSSQENGITNGGDWYIIDGCRQDHVTYFLGGREVTLELDHSHTTPAAELDAHWRYNCRSLINYARQCTYGLQGVVTDMDTEEPLGAMLELKGHDADSSMVFSEGSTGFYVRLLSEGLYDITFSAPNYYDTTISNVSVLNYHTSLLDVKMRSRGTGMGGYDPLMAGKDPGISFELWPVPASQRLWLELEMDAPARVKTTIYNSSGIQVPLSSLLQQAAYPAGKSIIELDVSALPPGAYFLVLQTEHYRSHRKIIIR